MGAAFQGERYFLVMPQTAFGAGPNDAEVEVTHTEW